MASEMSGDGEVVEDLFEEMISLIDEFDRADLSDITQTRSDFEWTRSLGDYKQISKDINHTCRIRSDEIKGNDEQINGISAEETKLKEGNSVLKREIARVRTQYESVAESMSGQCETVEDTLTSIEQHKSAMHHLEVTRRGLLLSQALTRRKLLVAKLTLMQNNAVAVQSLSDGSVECIAANPKKAVCLEARPVSGSTNTQSLPNVSSQLIESSQQGGKENELSGVEDVLDASEMECE